MKPAGTLLRDLTVADLDALPVGASFEHPGLVGGDPVVKGADGMWARAWGPRIPSAELHRHLDGVRRLILPTTRAAVVAAAKE